MDWFNSWIVSIVGGSIILSVFEILLPIGKMNKFLKNIIGIFYVYIIFLPVIKIIKTFI